MVIWNKIVRLDPALQIDRHHDVQSAGAESAHTDGSDAPCDTPGGQNVTEAEAMKDYALQQLGRRTAAGR